MYRILLFFKMNVSAYQIHVVDHRNDHIRKNKFAYFGTRYTPQCQILLIQHQCLCQ